MKKSGAFISKQTSRNAQLPRVYDYSDFRLYLCEVHKIRKSASKSWTYEKWSKRLGLKSASALIMILQGRRNPSAKLAQAIATSLQLKATETAYFQDLVSLEKTKKHPHLHLVMLERLQQRNPAKSIQLIDRDAFSTVSNWYCYAIREMVDLKDFREEPEWIQSRLNFKVSKKEITEAIASLISVGLLVRDAEGFLRYAQGAVCTGDDLISEGLIRFHEQTLENAKQSLRTTKIRHREISGVTLALKNEDIPRAKEILRKAHREIFNIAAQSGGDAIFQFETALFPLTQIEETNS